MTLMSWRLANLTFFRVASTDETTLSTSGPTQPLTLGHSFNSLNRNDNSSNSLDPSEENNLSLTLTQEPDAESAQRREAYSLNTIAEIRHSPAKNALSNPNLIKKQGISTDGELNRHWSFYKTAREHFDALPNDSPERTGQARFLRYMIEKCIWCITTRNNQRSAAPQSKSNPLWCELKSDQDMLLELHTIFQQAVAVMEKGSGGRKRSLDRYYGNCLTWSRVRIAH